MPVPTTFGVYSQGFGVPTTWNPADKANVTLSNGNLTALSNGSGSSFEGVRTVFGMSSGDKCYWETTVVSDPSFGVIGWANSSFSLTSSSTSANHSGLDSSGYAAGNVVSMAVDLVNNKFWFRVNGGLWNGSPTDNPATNSGGFTTASDGVTLISAVPRPIYGLYSAGGGQVTANFGSSAFAYAVPSGFSSGLR